MNLGIQDGITLGNALANTLRSGVDTLDSYDRERRPIVKSAVGITNRINEAATLRASWKGVLRDAIFPIVNIPVVNRQVANHLSRLVDR